VSNQAATKMRQAMRRWRWSHSRSCAIGSPAISGSPSRRDLNPRPPLEFALRRVHSQAHSSASSITNSVISSSLIPSISRST
jgi:hypothetical protein